MTPEQDPDAEALKQPELTHSPCWACVDHAGKLSAAEERDEARALSRTLVQALQKMSDAMQKSRAEGCTDHLDACDDAGAFWYDALEVAQAALRQASEAGVE